MRAATSSDASTVRVVGVTVMTTCVAATLVDKVIRCVMKIFSLASTIVWLGDRTTASTVVITENKRLTHERVWSRRAL